MQRIIALRWHSRLLAVATTLLFCVVTSAQPQAQTHISTLPVSSTPNGDLITMSLPGNVPLVMAPSTGGESCAGEAMLQHGEKSSSELAVPECWVSSGPLTYRQWDAVMGRFPLGGEEIADLDRPIRTLSLDEVTGEKGFVATLEAYKNKFSSPSALKFNLTASASDPEGGIRLTTSTAHVKAMRPISEAACTLSNAQSMSCGQTKSGALTGSDCTLNDGSYADLWAFQGTAGDHVTIGMTSSAFDTYLILWDASGTKVAEDDDSGTGLNSQISFTLPSTGTWYIGANSLSVGSTGNYTLTLQCGPSNNCPTTTISCGAHVAGTLATSDCVLGDNTYADRFQFFGTSGQVATIDMTSSAFDTYLVLIDPNGSIAVSDDDGGSGTNSRIVYTLNQTGNWLILANSLFTATGAYALDLACSTGNPSCNYTLGTSSASFGSSGGPGTVQVIGSPGSCNGSWNSQSNAFWITITSGGSGSGGGTSNVGYSVASNSSSASRTGTLTIAGRTFTITQSGINTTSCTASTTRACVLNNRFSVTVRYRGAFDNNPADSNAFVKPVTGFANPSFETAFFYFNSDSNIEVLMKILDQGNTDSGGHPTIAVLFGTATPLRVEVTITDTATGAVRTFTSDFNAMRGVTDFTAFLK